MSGCFCSTQAKERRKEERNTFSRVRHRSENVPRLRQRRRGCGSCNPPPSGQAVTVCFPPRLRAAPVLRAATHSVFAVSAVPARASCSASSGSMEGENPRRTRVGSLFSRASPFRHAGLRARHARHVACLTGQPRASAGLRTRHARGGHFAAVQPNCRLLFHPYPPQETAHLRRVSF